MKEKDEKKIKVLVAFNMLKEGWDELEERYELTFPPKGRDFTQEELAEKIGEYDVLCSVFDIPVQKELIEKGTNLKLISNYAVGYNNIDVKFADKQGITVTNTPKSVIEPTADLAMGHILGLTRTLAYWDRTMRKKKSKLEVDRLTHLGIGIQGKKLGIWGFGNIGKALAKRAQACGMEVIYYKRTRLPEEEEKKLNITYAKEKELVEQSDIISLHVPYTNETHHMINAKLLKKMKDSALLINTGRGALVDEKALIKALKSGTIAGAGLDVFEEDDVPSRALYKLDNVTLTPHIGTQTYEARLEMLKEMSDNIIGFFEKDREISKVEVD